jgi:hypothetical protein
MACCQHHRSPLRLVQRPLGTPQQPEQMVQQQAQRLRFHRRPPALA